MNKSFFLLIIVLLIGLGVIVSPATSYSYKWGDEVAGTSCTTSKCIKRDKKGKCTEYETKKWLHAGRDISGATEKDYCVYVNKDLYYITQHTYSKDWGIGIFMYPPDSTSKTFSVLHLRNVPSFKKDDNLKNQFIGRIPTSLNHGKSKPHLHIGYRAAKWDGSKASLAGWLPPKECTSRTDNYPAFPEEFQSPDTSFLTIKKPGKDGKCPSKLETY